MEAIVLAGGKGTRLKSVVSDIPKPMAPINNKPFLEYIFVHLQKNNVTKVVLSVGYQWKSIKKYFGNSFQNVPLLYSVEDTPLGTGGAIKKALNYVKNKEVFIVNGDTFFDINLSDLRLRKNSKLILALKQMKQFDRYGCVESNKNGFVTSFIEKKSCEIGNINGGIYLLSKNIFDGYQLGNRFSFEEFMTNNIENLKITSKVFFNYFIDIGIPEDYAKAKEELRDL